jgi:coiled-coil domain-containing protein 6
VFLYLELKLILIRVIEEEKMAHYVQEEKHIRDENLRLQRRLQMEMERREALCRHLSESESR